MSVFRLAKRPRSNEKQAVGAVWYSESSITGGDLGTPSLFDEPVLRTIADGVTDQTPWFEQVSRFIRMERTMSDSAIILFSGGQDSTVCLAWALRRFDLVETVGFDYGQRHAVELACRKEILRQLPDRFPQRRDRLGPDHIVDLGILGKISETSLTSEAEIKLRQDGLPNTFVPGRNLLFFTLAAAIAYRRGHKHIVGGMCETDYSGYPDCRDDTLKALQVTLNLGMDRRFVLHTPLMWIDKAGTWALAQELGGIEFVDLIREQTHSCYLGERSTLHEWGYGCGRCPACKLRQQGYLQYAKDSKIR